MAKWVVDYAAVAVSSNPDSNFIYHKEFENWEDAVEFGKDLVAKGSFSEGSSTYMLHYARLFCEPNIVETNEILGWDMFMKGEVENAESSDDSVGGTACIGQEHVDSDSQVEE